MGFSALNGSAGYLAAALWRQPIIVTVGLRVRAEARVPSALQA